MIELLYLLPIPFICLGMCIVYYGIRLRRRALVSLRWPTVYGVVLESSATLVPCGDPGIDVWEAKVHYRYEVGGTEFRSSQVSFAQHGSSDKSHAEGIVQRYPPGTRVRVYYDPADPRAAVLEPGTTRGTTMLIKIGLGFIGISVFVAWVMTLVFR